MTHPAPSPTGYGPAVRPTAPSPPAVTAAARVVVATAAVLAGLAAAAAAALVGVIEWSGCFLSCSAPDRPVSALLFALAVAALVAGGAGAWWAATTHARRVRALAWVVGGATSGYAAASVLVAGLDAWVHTRCTTEVGTPPTQYLACSPPDAVGGVAAALAGAVLLASVLRARRVLRGAR